VPVYEVRDYVGPVDFDDVIAWLQRDDLPVHFSFSFQGSQFVFRTEDERFSFVSGFMKAWDLMERGVL
jgi:hypothetical protein